MAAPKKKPKKALIQFVISLAVALFFGAITIGLIYVLATSYINYSQKEKSKLGSKLEEVQDELNRVKEKSKRLTQVKVTEVQTARAIEKGTYVTVEMQT